MVGAHEETLSAASVVVMPSVMGVGEIPKAVSKARESKM
jgi:hypothetical protein